MRRIYHFSTGGFHIRLLDRMVRGGQGFKCQSGYECRGLRRYTARCEVTWSSFSNGPCRVYNCWDVVVIPTSEQGSMPCAYTPCLGTPDSHHVQNAVLTLTNGKHVRPLLSPRHCRNPLYFSERGTQYRGYVDGILAYSLNRWLIRIERLT